MPAVDEYFRSLDQPTRRAFEHIRRLAMDVVPEAEQGTSYGMAALRYRHKPLLGFGVAKTHLSIFPFSAAVVDALRDRLGAFDVSKGTVRFSTITPLPDEVVRDLVKLRRDEIDRSTG